ncbi:MAG: tetratricopeptide repeat protein [Phycisphaerae bacterium]|nr:tetratricopeptide repeat protein [Phycisphaerae bacterium]
MFRKFISLYLLLILSLCCMSFAQDAEPFDEAHRLYAAANQMEELQKFEEAKTLYLQVLEQYPLSSFAAGARLHFSRFNVLLQLVDGNDAEAQTEIKSIEADFNDQPDFPWYLYGIGNQYEKLKRGNEAKSIYQRILRQYPDSPVAGGARLHFSRYAVAALIASGDDSAVQSEINSIAADLQGHPDLPWYLSSIIKQYERLGKYSESQMIKSLYQVQHDANELSMSTEYLKYSKAKVQLLIISQKYDEAKTALDKLIGVFSEHPDLPEVLYEIAQKYELSDKYKEAGDIYRQIILDYPESAYADKAKLDFKTAEVMTLVVTHDYDKAKISLDKLIIDFNDNPKLYSDAILKVMGVCYNDYYDKGETLIDGRQPGNELLRAAGERLEYCVQNRKSDENNDANMYYIVGQNFNLLGEYSRAVIYLAKTIETDPNFAKASSCLFAAGQCYEKMAKSGDIPQNQTLDAAEKCYLQVMAKQPGEFEKQYIKRWLEQRENLK